MYWSVKRMHLDSQTKLIYKIIVKPILIYKIIVKSIIICKDPDLIIFSVNISQVMYFGTKKTRLNETVLLSPQNICLE